MSKKRAKKTNATVENAKPGLQAKKTQTSLRMPFGAAAFALAASIAIVYFFFSGGAAYPPLSAINAAALGAQTLPFGVVTYLFDHAGLAHLLENLVGLVVFFLVVEAVLSYKDALAIFFLSGAIGGLAFLLVTPQQKIIGASAGIVGLAVAGILADPKRGVLALAFAALLVNWAAPAVADWAASESYKNIGQQKELAQAKAQELLGQQKTAEAQEQLRIAQEKQLLLDQQEKAKASETASGSADVAHVAGAMAGALYVIAFRRDAIKSRMKKATRAIANRMQRG